MFPPVGNVFWSQNGCDMLFLTSPQEAVQQMRAIDDRIIYKLNTSIPTISFADEVSAKDQCKKLYEQVWKITYPYGHPASPCSLLDHMVFIVCGIT